MPAFCGVFGCARRKERDGGSYFRIPAILNYKYKTNLNKLSKCRREKWIRSLKRQDLNAAKLKYILICDKHFISGKPASLEDVENVDWLPTCNMGYSIKTICKYDESRKFRYENRKQTKKSTDLEASTSHAPQNIIFEDIEADDLPENALSVSSQTDITADDISELIMQSAKLNLNPNYTDTRKNFYKNFINDNSMTKYYTGLDTYYTLKVIVEDITKFFKSHPNNALLPEDQVILFLMKLRLNLDFTDLGYRFQIDRKSATKYFYDVLESMFIRYKKLIVWPEREILRRNQPKCFQDSFKNTTVIIDCFEIFVETPSNLVTKAQCYSSYKHHETIKYLIGITPHGCICYISEAWGGRTSDKFLTENSRFFNNIIPGDIILADRGFLVKDFANLRKAQLNIPAFTKGQNQLHPVELEKTRAIANVRIHVERIIGTIRQKYKITSDTLPITMISKTVNGEAAIDKIVTVCCALINLCPGIVN